MFAAYTRSHYRPHKSAAAAGGGAKGPWSLCGPGPVTRGTAVDQISQARRPSFAIRALSCRPKGSAERAGEEMKNEILLLRSLFFLLLLSSISCYYHYSIYLSLSCSAVFGLFLPHFLVLLFKFLLPCFLFPALSPHRRPTAISTLWKHSFWLAAVSPCNLF